MRAGQPSRSVKFVVVEAELKRIADVPTPPPIPFPTSRITRPSRQYGARESVSDLHIVQKAAVVYAFRNATSI
jgi:hypothetical protein